MFFFSDLSSRVTVLSIVLWFWQTGVFYICWDEWHMFVDVSLVVVDRRSECDYVYGMYRSRRVWPNPREESDWSRSQPTLQIPRQRADRNVCRLSYRQQPVTMWWCSCITLLACNVKFENLFSTLFPKPLWHMYVSRLLTEKKWELIPVYRQFASRWL